MVNGKPRGIFKASRGIRQGDPLSPFLFVLVADILHRLVDRACNMGLLEGFQIGQDKVKVSHLQFVDDTVFFISKNESQLRKLVGILKIFGIASGLKINMHKSTLAGINVKEDEIANLARVVGCEPGSWPMSYLGMPLGDNPRRKCFWNPVIEKVKKRLEGWFKGCLSKGGRLTLIQSVLESLPTYYLSLFKAPISVCNNIEKLVRDFLWKSYRESHGDHLVKWCTVCKSKETGGLGIGNIAKKNEALLGKWLWRFPLEQNSFWCSIIKSKYGIHENGWDSNLVIRGSHRNPWKAISAGIETLKPLIRVKVGKGNATRFWEDLWVGDSNIASIFPRLYNVSRDKNSMISSLLSWNSPCSFSWNLQFRRNLNDREIEDFSSLLGIVSNVNLSNQNPDSRVWIGDKSGLFSCKSYFRSLVDHPGDCAFLPFNIIWKVGIPQKVKFFAWLASWRRVNTCDVLQMKRPNVSLSPTCCILCKQGEENIDHVLLHCNFTQSLWRKVGDIFNSVGAFPKTWHDFLGVAWLLRGNKKRSKFLWRCCCMALAWCVWQERNARIFEDKEMNVEEVWGRIQHLASLWACSSNSFRDYSVTEMSNNWAAVIR